MKTFLPQISGFVRSTPSALYERQRALIRLGILAAEEGRGPGSGVKLSAENVATLLIALIITDSWSETDDRVRTLYDAKPIGRRTCALTGAKTLGGSLAALLASREILDGFDSIDVSREQLSAALFKKGKRQRELSTMYASARTHGPVLPGPVTTITYDQRTLWPVNRALALALGNQIKEE